MRRLALLLLGTVAVSVIEAAAVGFPLGGDGGQELWAAVADAADSKGMDGMLALLEAGANVNWQNEDMVSPPLFGCGWCRALLTLTGVRAASVRNGSRRSFTAPCAAHAPSPTGCCDTAQTCMRCQHMAIAHCTSRPCTDTKTSCGSCWRMARERT